MTSHRRQAERGGITLLAVVIMAAIVGAVAATVVANAGIETTVLRRRMATAQALAAVDGCVDRIIADRTAGWDFIQDGWGPDAVAATADDGGLIAPAGCVARATSATTRLVLIATAQIPDGARTMEAVTRRAATPGVATPLWSTSAAGLSNLSGVVALEAHGTPSAAAVAAPLVPTDLDAWLAAHPNVALGPGIAAPRFAPAPPLAPLADRARVIGVSPGTALVSGAPTPRICFFDGDLLIDHPLNGVGLLVVTGQVRITSTLSYRGVVAALRGIQIDPTATLQLDGSLWLGANPSTPNDVRGHLAITFNPANVVLADALLPLPRLAELQSLRDREP